MENFFDLDQLDDLLAVIDADGPVAGEVLKEGIFVIEEFGVDLVRDGVFAFIKPAIGEKDLPYQRGKEQRKYVIGTIEDKPVELRVWDDGNFIVIDPPHQSGIQYVAYARASQNEKFRVLCMSFSEQEGFVQEVDFVEDSYIVGESYERDSMQDEKLDAERRQQYLDDLGSLFQNIQPTTVNELTSHEELSSNEEPHRDDIRTEIDELDDLLAGIEQAGDLLDQEIRDWPLDKKRSVAANSSDEWALKILSTEKNLVVRALVACNPNTPSEVRRQLMDNGGDYFLWLLANSAGSSPELLDELSQRTLTSVEEKERMDKAILNHPNVSLITKHRIQMKYGDL
ncbi:hypothetical protein KBC79_05690 [Candidatus Woesebacteria bacterium]|nr:hypothetical protein [Candidatus Woesebacteria bacterium]